MLVGIIIYSIPMFLTLLVISDFDFWKSLIGFLLVTFVIFLPLLFENDENRKNKEKMLQIEKIDEKKLVDWLMNSEERYFKYGEFIIERPNIFEEKGGDI